MGVIGILIEGLLKCVLFSGNNKSGINSIDIFVLEFFLLFSNFEIKNRINKVLLKESKSESEKSFWR